MMDKFHGMTVLASCGRGGFGEVRYCEEISGRRVAVKIVSKNTLGGEWQRELQGVKNYRRITAGVPELLEIFHVEDDDECFWYTMEPADDLNKGKGEYAPDTLAARLAGGPLPPEELFPVLSGIFRGLRAIHEAGFAHRDIKPDNVIFVDGKPKLADIGLLSSLSATMTRLAGSFGFIPPEVRSGDAPASSDRGSRKRNDLYAFGKVIYCAVTGNDPQEFPKIPPGVSLRSLPVKLFYHLALQLCENEPALRIGSVGAAEKELELVRRSLEAGEDLFCKSRFFWWQTRNFFYRLCTRNGKIWLIVPLTVLFTLAVVFFTRSGNLEKYLSWPSHVKPEPARRIEWSEGKEKATLRLSPGASLEMVRIAAGSFMMGSPADELGRSKDEKQHRVGLTREYWLGKYEVTQRQWKAVMRNNPSRFKGNDYPVEQVSWKEAKKFCAKLNLLYREELRSLGYRFDLPTEAQWEYACRAGTTAALNNGNKLDKVWGKSSNLEKIAWYGQNSGQSVHEVGKKEKNKWGLYDMHGNIYEWCRDWYGPYQEDSVDDPVGPPDGRRKVRRGGSWSDAVPNSSHRSASRVSYPPDFKHRDTGFRLVLTPGDPAAR